MISSDDRTGKLVGKKVFITGASRGIGKATAELFAAQGAELHLNGLSVDRLSQCAADIRAEYGVAVYEYAFNVGDADEVKCAFQQYQKQHGNLDVLVNNAGIMKNNMLAMVNAAELSETFATNVYGAIFCSQYASRLMARKKQGVIINISSIVAEEGYVGQSIYGASKAAIVGFTRSLAKELEAVNIRVNVISPGMTDTDLLSGMNIDKNENEMSKPIDIAEEILSIVLDSSRIKSGDTLTFDPKSKRHINTVRTDNVR